MPVRWLIRAYFVVQKHAAIVVVAKISNWWLLTWLLRDCHVNNHIVSLFAAGMDAPLPISPSGSSTLAFSLCNAEPSEGVYVWDFPAFQSQYLEPIVAALAPVAKLAIESHVLYYTPAKLVVEWSERHGAFVVPHSQLPFFMDAEWNIYSSGLGIMRQNRSHQAAPVQDLETQSDSPGVTGVDPTLSPQHIASNVLQFVAYVPPAQQQPLKFESADGEVSDTDSYWVPSWGALMAGHLLSASNRTPCAAKAACTDEATHADSSVTGVSADAGIRRLDSYIMHHLASTAVAQLRRLLGLHDELQFADAALPYLQAISQAESQRSAAGRPSGTAAAARGEAAGSSGPGEPARKAPVLLHLPDRSAGFAAWEIDALLRKRAGSSLRTAAGTLGSLSQLARDLPNLEMPDFIGDQVRQSVEQLEKAIAHARSGDYSAFAHSTRAASAAAEAAFSHPSVLAQLNVPETHKLGVYMPFFFPAFLPIISGLITQLKRYLRRRKEHQRLVQAKEESKQK